MFPGSGNHQSVVPGIGPQQRIDVGRLIRPSDDGLHPRPLPLRQVVKDVPQLMDLTALDEGGLAEDRAQRGDLAAREAQRRSAGLAEAALQPKMEADSLQRASVEEEEELQM